MEEDQTPDSTQSGHARSAPARDPSPLDVIPDLEALARSMADAVLVTDIQRRVVVWNSAAEQLYGISAADAIGADIETLYDSTIIGAGVSSAGARAVTMREGSWTGRVADRTRLGTSVGQELFIETVLSRLDTVDGRPVGVLGVKRDVTPSVIVERELSALVTLTTAAGEVRSRHTMAERALEVLTGAIGATFGQIVIPEGDGCHELATSGHPALHATMLTKSGWRSSPIIRAVGDAGHVVKGRIDQLPLAGPVRSAMLAAGLRSMTIVGLHRGGELIGTLAVGWDAEDPKAPSDAVILLVAAHVARSLDNARLVEEVIRRVEAERATEARLRALDALVRLGTSAVDEQELLDRSTVLVDQILGALGTAYIVLSTGGDVECTSDPAKIHPAIAAWITATNPDHRAAFRRSRPGERTFIEGFDAGTAPPDVVSLARDGGLRAFVAVPVRADDQIVGGIVSWFDRSPGDIAVDRATLEQVAMVTATALANLRLRDRVLVSERRYRTLFEESPEALLVARRDGIITEVNAAAAAMYRVDRGWFLGRPLSALGDVDEAAVLARVAEKAGRGVVAGGALARRPDGSSLPQEFEIGPVTIDDELRLLVRIRDVTDERRLQAELVQAQKMEATGQLVSGVAHELNNPIAAILGFSELIRRDPALPADLRASADMLVGEAERTRRIVQNLLDFARQRPPERYPTSIRDLIDSVVTLQSYSLGSREVQLDTDIAPDLPLVELDRGQLQQVLVNLTHNAVYAVRSVGGGRIRISARTEGADHGSVRITVADDGPGVAAADIEHVFDAFFTTKPPSEGTGLGLSVSYGIVAAHGGRLRYGPAETGRGAAFTFDLPVKAAYPANDGVRAETGAQTRAGSGGTGASEATAAVGRADRPKPASASPGAAALGGPSRPRVLVLDDEQSIRSLLEKALTAFGAEVVAVADGEAAMEAVGGQPFDVYLVDHQLAGLSGLDVFEAVTADRPDAAGRFMLMSGDVQNEAIERFTASHGVAILAKPFDLESLRRAVDAILGGEARG